MTFEPLQVELDESGITKFIKRYHFKTSEKKDIVMLYRQLHPRVHASFHHVIEGDTVFVVVTLGDAFDSFQDSFLQKGEIQKAFIIDCLGTEMLSIAYEEVDKKIFEKTGLYVGSYVFAGSDKMPLEELAGVMAKLGQKIVKCNESFVLVPKKSVVFSAKLHEKRTEKHSDCANCSAVSCPMRNEPQKKKSSSKSGAKRKKGLVHLYTGEGKGKTTAAIGLAVRAAGAGRKVVFSQFMKGRKTSELNSLSLIPGITIVRSDKELGWLRRDDEEQCEMFRVVHNEILDKITELIQAGECDVLIMDEITYPYNYGVIDKKRLEELIDNKPSGMEIVMTGRNADELLADRADYITCMEKIRHPYDKGIEAREGIEY